VKPVTVDILIIGGGINGCGIARDAAGRGYSVLLCEANDLGSGTSSASTKLIHGGLRYLQYCEFRLVREALREREVLWRMAPHIIWPLRFVLPHHRSLRPAWVLRFGLFLYDHLGGRRLLPATRTLDLRRDPAGAPLKRDYVGAFEYSDAWVEDSRLVVLNARSAREHGADIRVRTAVKRIWREHGIWSAEIEDQNTGELSRAYARLIVNAAGPWIGRVLQQIGDRDHLDRVRLVKGSHIVVRKLFEHDRCYIFQNADDRIVFAIPYEHDFTLIGTTDQDFSGDPAEVHIDDDEIDYLITLANRYFKEPIDRSDVVWTYSGVRPLYDSGASSAQEATRDYVLVLGGMQGGPKILNIFGGKITTYRRLAEAAMDKIGGELGIRGRKWTAEQPLPGGDFPVTGFEALVGRLQAAHPGIAADTIRRLARAYGTDAAKILRGAVVDADLGRDFGAGLSEREVRYLAETEWAQAAADIAWRRSKLGLRLGSGELAALDAYLDQLAGAHAAVQ
jgi:glycerol-3-phosphate dehydrogenase